MSYTVQEFNTSIIKNLRKDRHNIVYNKIYKEDTYNNKALFFITYKCPETDNTILLYCYGFNVEPTREKCFKTNKGALYYLSRQPIHLMDGNTNPYTIDDYIALRHIIINFNTVI